MRHVDYKSHLYYNETMDWKEAIKRSLGKPYKVKMYLMQEIVWNYGAGVACKKTLSPRNEKLLWYVNNKDDYTFNLDAIRDPDVKYPNSKKNGKLRCNILGKNPSDVWQIAKVTSGFNRSSEERTNHPAQFPLDLIDRITLGFSNANDILLDNGKSFSNCCVISNHFEESTFSYGLFIFTASYFVNT